MEPRSDHIQEQSIAGLTVFIGADVPEAASGLMLASAPPPATDERWLAATQYSRKLVSGTNSQPTAVWRYSYGPRVIVPPHRHGTHEVYFILSGSMDIAGRRLGTGDGFTVCAGTTYHWVAGDHGVDVLKIRAHEPFSTEFVVGDNPND